MWTNRSTAPLNCVYFGYAVGALLSILIVRAFRKKDPLIDNLNSLVNVKEGQFQSELVGPYTIASVFCLISSIGFGLIAYKQHKIKKAEIKKLHRYQSVAKEEINRRSKSKRVFNKGIFWKTCSPTTCGQGYLAYGFILITLLLLYNFFFGKYFCFLFFLFNKIFLLFKVELNKVLQNFLFHFLNMNILI
jgi:hypothetical protein